MEFPGTISKTVLHLHYFSYYIFKLEPIHFNTRFFEDAYYFPGDKS